MAEASLQFARSSNRLADPGLQDGTATGGFWTGCSAAAALARAVQRDIFPRLAARPDAETRRAAGVLAGSIGILAGLVLAQELPSARAYLERVRGRGIAAETLCLELLAPTARHFGDLWTEDLVDFGQVTIGLGHLHTLLREFSPAPALPAPLTRPRGAKACLRCGLLAAAPGEQHTFGLAMITAFFRCAGWAIWSGAPDNSAELKSIVRGQWFDMAGFSLAYEGRLDAVRAAIRDVRQFSRNPCIRILVGGPVFIEYPEFVAQVGADAMAAGGRQAVLQAERLLTRPLAKV